MDSLAASNKLEVAGGRPGEPCGRRPTPPKTRGIQEGAGQLQGWALTVAATSFAGSAHCRLSIAEQLKTANDTVLKRFARMLTQNVLLLRQADSAKIATQPRGMGRR